MCYGHVYTATATNQHGSNYCTALINGPVQTIYVGPIYVQKEQNNAVRWPPYTPTVFTPRTMIAPHAWECYIEKDKYHLNFGIFLFKRLTASLGAPGRPAGQPVQGLRPA